MVNDGDLMSWSLDFAPDEATRKKSWSTIPRGCSGSERSERPWPLLVAPIGGPSPDWQRLFAAELPGVEIRMFPEIGDPADIDVAAIARVPPGVLATLPNLRLIVSLMAGQETLLADRTLPQIRADRARGQVRRATR